VKKVPENFIATIYPLLTMTEVLKDPDLVSSRFGEKVSEIDFEWVLIDTTFIHHREEKIFGNSPLKLHGKNVSVWNLFEFSKDVSWHHRLFLFKSLYG
jgi:hypothetical protein